MNKGILTLPEPLDSDRQPRRERMGKVARAPYLDYGQRRRGAVEPVPEPPRVPRITLTLQALQERQKHNSLQLILQPTDRLLSRWGESEGNGMPNPFADIRETHYSPLPPDLQAKVSLIVAESPWETFARKWYRTDLTIKALAELLCVSRRQLYYDWNSSLWYFNGQFQAARIHE